MIRINNKVDYSIPGNKPSITNAKVFRIHVCTESAELIGYPHRVFPLNCLTKSKS